MILYCSRTKPMYLYFCCIVLLMSALQCTISYGPCVMPPFHIWLPLFHIWWVRQLEWFCCLKLNNMYLHGATWKIGLLSWCHWKIQTALLVPVKNIGGCHWKYQTAPLAPLKNTLLAPLKHTLLALLKNSAVLVLLKKSNCSTGTTEIGLLCWRCWKKD